MFIFSPALALAGGSATVAGPLPSNTVGVGTTVTFSIIASGFTNPTYTVVDSVGGGVSNINISAYGDFNWTPNNSDIGSHTITVTVNDSQGNSASTATTITVIAPTATIGGLLPGTTVRFGNPVTFSVSSNGFTSPQYSVADSYPYSTVTSASTDGMGNFHWTPIYQDIGTHTLTATVRDYQGHVATASQQITVTGLALVSLSPVSPASTVHVGDAVSFSATTTGFTSPTFTVADAFTSSLGTSTLAIDANGKVTWTPNSNDIGTHVFTVSASDSSGNTGSVQTTVQVVYGSAPVYTPVVTPYNATATTGSNASTASTYIFKTLLTVGSTGKDITALQQLLAKLGFLSVAPTGYFGALTKAALQKYQSAHAISPVGYTGPATRAALNTGK